MNRETSPKLPSEALIRVDQPHAILREQLIPAAQPAGIELQRLAGRESSGLLEQLQQQAFELGQRLQWQQTELDRRQAEFYAQVARVETEQRTARLICAEREIELNEQLRQAIADTATAASLDNVAVEHVFRAHPPQQAMPHALAPTEAAMGKKWEQRFAQLDESERHLQAQIAQLDYDRQKLDEQREQLRRRTQQMDDETQRAASQAQTHFEQELKQLQVRSKELDQRKISVDKLHQDALHMVREALEIRLCTEQLWGELTETHSSVELTHRLAELRCKLMDLFHLADQRLAEQRSELESLIEALTQHEAALRKERKELQDWIARRQADIEADARRLRTREREIEQQEHELSRLKDEWLLQRHEYEQSLRRLSRLAETER